MKRFLLLTCLFAVFSVAYPSSGGNDGYGLEYLKSESIFQDVKTVNAESISVNQTYDVQNSISVIPTAYKKCSLNYQSLKSAALDIPDIPPISNIYNYTKNYAENNNNKDLPEVADLSPQSDYVRGNSLSKISQKIPLPINILRQ